VPTISFNQIEDFFEKSQPAIQPAMGLFG